jgi:DNA-binding NtrC family response regulator
MQRGAFDYMVKPVEENRLCTSVRRAVEMRELRRENRRLRDELVAVADSEERLAPFSPIITAHPRMRSLFQYIAAIAPSAQPVLITGETGTGKELFARAVHEASERTGEFVAVNVAGLDDTFFSDALFGHARGAYTGAHEARQGFVEEAAEGTLFLDEIGDLSQASQVKLLRLLQNNEYTPLGSSTQRRSRARVVAATHRNLEQARDEGRLRADLYYRLNTHRVDVPPLRERREDIPILLSHFMETASKALGKPKPSYPPELVDLLFVHEFPGNVRELESMVFDAVGRHQGGVLSLEAIRERTGTGAEPRQRPRRWAETLTPEDFPTIQEATEHLISEAMRLANDNQAIAASLLGISRPALNRRLRHPSARAADARERVEAEDV